jgi:predicted DCC family thiol-disulfide oxidoreductase YuxK
MFAEHWRNGLGAWLPASMPYYISAINMSWLLDSEILQKTIGYIILVFQFTFLFLFHFRYLRPLYFVVGAGLHLGITLTLNIYPFGLGMLIFYSLMLPFAWYKKIGCYLTEKMPTLTVFYDEQCPLCARTVLTINHFDIFNCIDFKGAQTYASQYPTINKISRATLLTDLYALDEDDTVYSGVNTYAQILINMRYLAVAGYFLKIPIVYDFACKKYRAIADSRTRILCDSHCEPAASITAPLSLYDQIFSPTSEKLARRNIHRLSKLLILISILQINSSVYYGLIYRLDIDTKTTVVTALLTKVSNSFVHYSSAFIGITPHALYLHDHFEGYDHLLAITYLDSEGEEKWLPFVTPEGRLASPNWGRVHSMWANIAVTPTIDHWRLSKFIMKITAFWGIDEGLDLNAIVFNIKLKKISAPSYWVEGLLESNLSGEWATIGSATWDSKSIDISLPDNINAL